MSRIALFQVCFLVVSSLAEGVHFNQINIPRQATTTSQDPPSGTPLLFLAPPSLITTCEPATFSWTYGGPSLPMTLLLTNVNVPQNFPPPTPTSNPPPNTFTNRSQKRALSTTQQISVDPLFPAIDKSFTWRSVTLSQGWYRLYAQIELSDSIYTASSGSYVYVQNGPDVSCLLSSSQSSTPTNPSTSPPITSTPTLPISTSSGPAVPPIAALSSGGVSKGAIAGAAVGGVVLVAAAIFLLIFVRRSSSRSQGAARSARQQDRWGGLGSVDSATRDAATAESKAAQRPSRRLSKNGSRSNRHNMSDEKVLPVRASLSADSRSRGVDRTSSTSGSPPFSSPFSDSRAIVDGGAVLPSSMVRQPSIATTTSSSRPPTNRSLSSFAEVAAATEIGYATSSNDHNHSSSRKLNRNSMPAYPPNSPTSPYGGSAQAASASTAAVASTKKDRKTERKTPRKPVPAYDPNLVGSMESTSPLTGGSSSPGTSPTGTTLSHSTMPEGLQLHHKKSFGLPDDGRPMHYLIPDMPPGGQR